MAVVKKQIPLDLLGSSIPFDLVQFSSHKITNLTLISQKGAKYGEFLNPREGLKKIRRITDAVGTSQNAGRASYVFNDKLFTVIGGLVYAFDNTLNQIYIGSLNTTRGHVSISDNGQQLMLVDGVDGWIYDKDTSLFSQITSPNFPSSPQSVSIMGLRFVVNYGETNRWSISDQLNGLDWSGLEAQINAYPDILIGSAFLNNRLYLFGKESVEPWYDAGAPDFPFRRDNNSILNYGCAAVGSIVQALGYIVFLTQSTQGVSSVVLIEGTVPVVVSNASIEQEFKKYEVIKDATSYLYKNDIGHIIYVINFPTENKTWAFDITESKATNIKRWFLFETEGNRFLAESHSFFNKKHYVLSHNDNCLYELNSKYNKDDNANIKREIVSPHIYVSPHGYVSIYEIVFDMLQGYGAPYNTYYGEDEEDETPILFLRLSRNGGISYGNRITSKLGQSGRFKNKTRFLRLGEAQSIVIAIEYYNSVPWSFFKCSALVGVAA